MIPTALGNIVGGGLFVGMAYWYLYLTGEDAVKVDFGISGPRAALEAAGPVGPPLDEKDRRLTDPMLDANMRSAYLPNSGGLLSSNIGRELSDDSRNARSLAEREKEEAAGDSV